MSGNLEQIRNYVQLRGDIATSGQPGRRQFEMISSHGYTAVINLAMPDHSDSIADEGSIVTGLGMSYIHLPVPFDNPTPGHVRKFCLIMDCFRDEKVWVHCIMNYRVSAFMWHYLVTVVGLDEQEARSPMFDRWQPDSVWAGVLGWTASQTGIGKSGARSI